MLFPWLSTFWSSIAFPLRHRTKTLHTVLGIKKHNMQWHLTLFCLFFSWFFSISNFLFFFFLDLYWALSWHTELTDIQLTDSMTLLWQGGWSVISPDVSSNFNNSVSLWFKLRRQQVKYFYFATVQDTGITPVPVLCTASATPIQEKWMQTGSSTENHY